MSYRLVVMGASLGGFRTLPLVLSSLPASFPLPVVVVQHRSADSGDRLRMMLQRNCNLRVQEPCDKQPISPGRVYLAPADYHLLVEGEAFALSTEAPVSYARPSVDVLFESAAESWGAQVIGVILTGANSDGAEGAARIKASGGLVIVQDPEDAESPVMPRAALQRAEIDAVLPASAIGPFLIERADGKPFIQRSNRPSHSDG